MEEYRDIKGYEGVYAVSNIGNIKSLERKVKHSKGGIKTLKERLLTPSLSSNNYLSVKLYCNGKGIRRTVHQLVAITFLNHTPSGYKLVVNHKDFNKLNNNLSNLEIITHRENANKKHLKSTSKYTGVSYRKERNTWLDLIYIKDKQVNLGTFKTEEEASEAYQNKLKQLNEKN